MAGEAASLRPGQAWPKLQKSITGFQRDKRSVSLSGRGWAVDDRRDLRVSERIRVMGEARLHVAFGTGQAGNALTARLPRLGVAVRAERFPLLQRGRLVAADRAGALLVVLENLCGYGPAEGRAGPPREEEKES